MSIVIYHNPRCGKSRQTLELLRRHGRNPAVIEYLQSPPSAEELQEILRLLGLRPRDLMRKKEPAYAENALDNGDLSDDELLRAMIEHPILIERPIVLANGRAALGRPPEAVLDIL